MAMPRERMDSVEAHPGRRQFLQIAAACAGGVSAAAGAATPHDRIELGSIAAPTEAQERPPPLPIPDAQKVGYAIVGLGRLTLNQLMPAFARCRYSRPVALVSGDRAKAGKLAARHGIADSSIYDYRNFDRLADNPAVTVVYIVLPNSMHAEFTVRAARAGKHVLCEKPMAVSVAECRQMIDECKRASVRLMIAYRSQYEPFDRMLVKHIREGRYGALQSLTAFNGQNQGDPSQWRLKRALAGGGSLPDVGLYCLNAARFLSGEEPSSVVAQITAPSRDPRFTEVEDTVHFLLQFPSGWAASCGSSYSTHKSQFMRLCFERAWAELDPAFAYSGIRLRIGGVEADHNVVHEPAPGPGDQFAAEIDHMSRCVLDGTVPHTPGEEGLQDQRVMEAIYESARSGRRVTLAPPPAPTRGPEPVDDDA